VHTHPYGFVTFFQGIHAVETGCLQCFRRRGDGYVRSEGAGVFFLKD